VIDQELEGLWDGGVTLKTNYTATKGAAALHSGMQGGWSLRSRCVLHPVFRVSEFSGCIVKALSARRAASPQPLPLSVSP